MLSLKHIMEYEVLPTWAFALSSARFYAQQGSIVRANLVCTEKKKHTHTLNIVNLTDKFHFCVHR